MINLVEVEWLDSMTDGGWISKDDAIARATKDAMLHRSVGYLIHETDDMILLAGSRDEYCDQLCGTMQIPRVAVLTIKSLSFITI